MAIFFFCLMFLVLNYLLNKTKSFMPFFMLFECGFSAVFWELNKMSMHFFKIGIIFILFDLELMFLIFLLKNQSHFYMIFVIHAFIFGTFLLEGANKLLKWSL